jgi:AcrR family transcriptional regulator
VSDEDLLGRIDSALSTRSGAGAWSLHDVAPAAGISPAGLIKRFGSKEGLLHALARRWIELVPTAARAEARPEDELRAYVTAAFGAPSSAAAVFALSELLGDLLSPESTVLLREGWAKQARYLGLLLQGLELPRLENPHQGALLLLDALHGALYRHAAELEPTTTTDTLDHLLKAWK